MQAVLQVLQYVVALAFAFLGAISVVDLVRWPGRRRAYIAMALGFLGLTSLVAQVGQLVGGNPPWVLPVFVVAFQLSGFGLVLLRDSFIRLPAWGWGIAVLGLGGTAAALLILGFPNAPAKPTTLQYSALVGVFVAWMAAVAEPSLQFWLASRRLPTVQRRRMQALSLGYVGIVAVLLLSLFIPSAATNIAVRIATSLVTLAMVPLLYAGFSPPQWLRRIWREAEEEPFREAVHDLLLFSPTRRGLAERGVEWAIRLVGAESGLLVDGDGQVMAARGLGPDEAARRAEALRGDEPDAVEVAAGLSGRSIVLPMPLDNGTGYMVVEAGPFTPLFGQDEVVRLRQYVSSVTAALDRARVSERVIALEEVKSRFLKLASHELRGPLALVKGYMSMVNEGSLTIEELERVMPMIQGRLEQMSTMLNEMLETARLEDDRLELKPELFDMRQAVQSVATALAPLAGKERPLRVKVPEQEVPVVADRSRVETIVTNMLDNAIKYSPAGGDIDCIVEVRGGDALVEVIDRGIGIAGEDMGTVFTRFGRVTNDATISIPGTGLGLYLSRELARMHSGDLTARSRAGEGSTFTLQLPLAGAAA